MNDASSGATGSTLGARLGCLVLLLLAAGGIWWFFNASNAGPRHEVASYTRDYADLCAGRPIPGAAPYRPGGGVHPIAVFANSQGNEYGIGDEVTFDFPDRTVLNPTDPAVVQLVACTKVDDRDQQVGTCQFTNSSAPLYSTTVTVTVYEARTGDPVGEPMPLRGASTECPVSLLYRAYSGPTVYTTPTDQQYRDVLDPYIRR